MNRYTYINGYKRPDYKCAMCGKDHYGSCGLTGSVWGAEFYVSQQLPDNLGYPPSVNIGERQWSDVY